MEQDRTLWLKKADHFSDLVAIEAERIAAIMEKRARLNDPESIYRLGWPLATAQKRLDAFARERDRAYAQIGM